MFEDFCRLSRGIEVIFIFIYKSPHIIYILEKKFIKQMSENHKSSQDAWRALQEISKQEREHAQKLYKIIQDLVQQHGDIIPKETLLTELGFKSVDEMVDWELEWLPRKELNIKFEYQTDYVRIVKNPVDEEDLGIYEYF